MAAFRRISLGRGLFAVIDAKDWPVVQSFTWHGHFSKKWYARTTERSSRRKIYLHRLLMGEPENQVDHRNGDGLDCRRRNLRLATNSENSYNMRRRAGSSRFKGVTARKTVKGMKWIAQIKVNYKHSYLGIFNTEEEAAAGYDSAARLHFGEFAWLNTEREIK